MEGIFKIDIILNQNAKIVPTYFVKSAKTITTDLT